MAVKFVWRLWARGSVRLVGEMREKQREEQRYEGRKVRFMRVESLYLYLGHCPVYERPSSRRQRLACDEGYICRTSSKVL